MERFKAYSWGGGFVIVDAILLSESFRNVADFVANDLACVIVFAFAYELALEGSFSVKRKVR